jgi:type III pantothenate kinase
MNLIIDIGNSSTKLAIFNGKQKVAILRYDELTEKILKELILNYKILKAIISSVKEIPAFLISILKQQVNYLHILSYESGLPYSIEYETPETLGTDRIAAVAGAYSAFQGSDVLIIDAGTAITYDFLKGTKYTGGSISPGIDMRFKALNKFTVKLPLVSRSEGFSFPPRNTTDAIRAGVITGVTYEINEYIRTFKKKHKYLKVIVTGGDGSYLKDKISDEIIYLPDIVIDGLNFILEYNAK